jgi:hypothetical protein
MQRFTPQRTRTEYEEEKMRVLDNSARVFLFGVVVAFGRSSESVEKKKIEESREETRGEGVKCEARRLHTPV